MLTSPITTPSFHARVLALVSNHIAEIERNLGIELPIPTVSSLSPVDTPLAPGDIVPHLLAIVSPWLDLCSPDPVIYNISRQVLEIEVAYAAFCGIGNVILPSPRLRHGRLHGEGVAQFAYAVQETLKIAQYIQLSVIMPMMDDPEQDDENLEGHLAREARARYTGFSDGYSQNNPMESTRESLKEMDQNDDAASVRRRRAAKVDFFGTWDAWNVIRTICTYNARLFVGKNRSISPLLSLTSFLRNPMNRRL